MKITFVLAFSALVSLANANDFPGWQGLRVIKVDHGAYKMTPISDGFGLGKSLMVVQTRQSRLDFYHYSGRKAEEIDFSKLENPNFLPMAEDFERTELPLPRLPQVATVHDVDGDGIDEIFLIQSDPRKLLVFKKREGDWTRIKEWEISEGDLSTSQPILVRPTRKSLQVLVSFQSGIQMIDYADSDVDWLQPRERDVERNRWWLVDFDEDGDTDIVEARNTVDSPVRWYESEGDKFRPAVNISDDITNTNVARLAQSKEGAKIVFLGANQANTVSYYEMGRSEESKFGSRNLLPISQPESGGWVTIMLEGKKSILELGRNKPVLNVFQQEEGFWEFLKSYPILQDITAIEAVRDKANTILFRVEDEGQLFESHWESGRFTFPKRLAASVEDASEWKILAFDQYGKETWWVTQRGEELVLSVWSSRRKEALETVFPGVKGEYERCVWLGGETLLVKKKFSKSAELCRLVDGKAVFTSSRFKGSDIRQIAYFEGTLYLPEEGVVQKLDENLEVLDQIMLEGDYSIRSFAPVSDKSAYALEDDGEHVHFMEADDSGIFQSIERIQIPYSLGISLDEVLGLTFISGSYINVPQEGSSEQLVLDFSIDPNEGDRREYEKHSIGTIFVVDVDGDKIDEIAAVDYGQKNIIIYGEREDGFEEVISWKVFDDGKYPYGQDTGGRGGVNPYRMLSFDFDGDSHQDLVLASHDRILIYLAKDS